MKNSIQIIAIALLSFSNVVSASGLIKKIDLINDSKTVQAKMVSYANSDLLQEEIAGLQTYFNTVSDVINLDLKITENEHDLKTCFVNYANQDLLPAEIQIEKTETTIEYQIKSDLEILGIEQVKTEYINYANDGMFGLEIGTLQSAALSIDDIIVTNNKITESKKAFFQKNITSKIAIKKALRY